MCKRRFLIICVLLALIGLILVFDAKAETAPVTLYAAHKEGDLNIRDKPYGERVGYLLPGDSVEYVEQEGDWVRVKINIDSGGGWVKADYLTIDPAAAGLYTNISGGRVRLREMPGGRATGWLGTGKTVEVLAVLPDENGELWGRTEKGYVALKYFEKEAEHGSQ